MDYLPGLIVVGLLLWLAHDLYKSETSSEQEDLEQDETESFYNK